ncbi:nicotinate phosphoribosyltransferase, partial [Limosilactobacillus reuteri]
VLDEKTIQKFQMQRAKIDTCGIWTNLITPYDQQTLGAVYKLVALEEADGHVVDTIQFSIHVGPLATPGHSPVWGSRARGVGGW